MSEEIQKDVAMMGTLRQAGIQPGAHVRAEPGGLGVRLTVDGLPGCEIDPRHRPIYSCPAPDRRRFEEVP